MESRFWRLIERAHAIIGLILVCAEGLGMAAFTRYLADYAQTTRGFLLEAAGFAFLFWLGIVLDRWLRGRKGDLAGMVTERASFVGRWQVFCRAGDQLLRHRIELDENGNAAFYSELNKREDEGAWRYAHGEASITWKRRGVSYLRNTPEGMYEFAYSQQLPECKMSLAIQLKGS
jgi:hypothetical protein